MRIQTEVVNGKCPTCDEHTMLVGITNQLYRCMNCGSDLEQHVNGKISYLPHIATPEDKDFVRLRRKKNKLVTLMYSIFLIMFVSFMSWLSKFLILIL